MGGFGFLLSGGQTRMEAVPRIHAELNMKQQPGPPSPAARFRPAILTIRQRASALISFITFMASTMQSVCPASTVSPSLTKGALVGEDAR